MPRELRKGRERCTATRRDGKPCQAPAVPEMLICRRHGGLAPQVLIVSRYRELQLRFFRAQQECLAARGTKGEDAALARHGDALSELHAYEEKLAHLRELQAEVRERRPKGTLARAPEPPIVRLAKLQRRAAEQARWKPRQADPMEASPSRTRARQGG